MDSRNHVRSFCPCTLRIFIKSSGKFEGIFICPCLHFRPRRGCKGSRRVSASAPELSPTVVAPADSQSGFRARRHPPFYRLCRPRAPSLDRGNRRDDTCRRIPASPQRVWDLDHHGAETKIHRIIVAHRRGLSVSRARLSYQREANFSVTDIIQGPSAVNIIWVPSHVLAMEAHCSLPEFHSFSLLHGILRLDRPGAEISSCIVGVETSTDWQ